MNIINIIHTHKQRQTHNHYLGFWRASASVALHLVKDKHAHMPRIPRKSCFPPCQHHDNTILPQDAATHCNTLQHTTTHPPNSTVRSGTNHVRFPLCSSCSSCQHHGHQDNTNPSRHTETLDLSYHLKM